MQAFPENLDEYIDFAERAVERLYQTQTVEDLFAAVLISAHIIDWYCLEVEGREYYGKRDGERFKALFPVWGLLCQLNNGAKHARKREGEAHLSELQRAEVEWEDVDAWEHLGIDLDYWRVDYEGEERSVYALCKYFVQDVRNHREKLKSTGTPEAESVSDPG